LASLARRYLAKLALSEAAERLGREKASRTLSIVSRENETAAHNQVLLKLRRRPFILRPERRGTERWLDVLQTQVQPSTVTDSKRCCTLLAAGSALSCFALALARETAHGRRTPVPALAIALQFNSALRRTVVSAPGVDCTTKTSRAAAEAARLV
jgi:hypothetical protein